MATYADLNFTPFTYTRDEWDGPSGANLITSFGQGKSSGGETFRQWLDRTNAEAQSVVAQEAARIKQIQDWKNSPEGQAQIVRNQYDLFSGRQPERLQYYESPAEYQNYYITSPFSSGFTTPTIHDPYQGAEYQKAWTDYYKQFLPYGVESTTEFSPLATMLNSQAIGSFSKLMQPGGEMSMTPVANQPGYKFYTGFSKEQLDAVKNDPELYQFATNWNTQVQAAEDWGVKLQNPYSPFLELTPADYVAPEKHKTVKYGAKFGGEPGAQAIGKTNNNPIPNTPGAGLWVYGIDPENPSSIANAYNKIFFRGGDAGAKEALAAFAPKQNKDGSWEKRTSIDDLYKFGSELDAYYRGLAQKIDLPKRGIMDSIAGKVILGALTSAATGGLGTIVGGLTGSAAAGNLASLGASAAIGGAQGGLEGALTSALGSAVGAGIDQAGGLGNIGDFVSDPFGNIGAAYGLGDSAFSGLNFSGMEEAAQVGPGSVAQNTSASLNPNSLSGNQEFYAPSFGNADNYMGEVVISAPAGDISQIAGGGFGSAAGGAAGSTIGQILTGNGAAGAGSLDVGGLLDTGAPAIGSPGSPTGNIQSVVPGAGTSMGSGQPGATPYGEIGPEGLPTGQPGPYSDAYGAGMTGGPQGGLLTDMTNEEMLAAAGAGLLGGAALFGGAGSGATGDGATAAPYGGEVYGTTGYGAGGDGMGGDGTGGDGAGGDGNFRFNFPSFDFGAAPQVMGDLGELLSGGKVGAKTKGGKSPYKRIKSPPRRRGITVRRA